MAKYAKLTSAPVPQSEPLNERQVKNNAGGFVFQLDDWSRLDRFLILGSDSSTYYQSAKQLTKENAACVQRCYDLDFTRTVNQIVTISDEGRAPKNDAAIFALALGACHNDVRVRTAALQAMPKVCRIGTHLFQFVDCCRALGRGWGRAMMRAVANWYDSRPVDNLAYQIIKYRSRENYSHKRLFQLSHPKGGNESQFGDTNPYKGGKAGKKPRVEGSERIITKDLTGKDLQRQTLYRWVCEKPIDPLDLPDIVSAHREAMDTVTTQARRLTLIKTCNLPWEALPTECNKDPDIWKAMLPKMGMTALIRNLGGMTQYGALKPLEDEVELVVNRLTNEEELKKARIHPFNLLVAMSVYKSGKSDKGSRSWNPIPQVGDALEKAFYLAFKNIVPSGKRTMICLDVSGSMSSPLMGSPLEVASAAAAMAMVTMRTESKWHVMAFTDRIKDLKFGGQENLEGVLRKTRNQTFGGTDCSLPMIYAQEQGLNVDVFQVYTDNETWAGRIHPSKALQDYRRKMGIQAKLVVVGMTSTGFSIADPKDGGMLDVVGFDSAAPAVIADFARN